MKTDPGFGSPGTRRSCHSRLGLLIVGPAVTSLDAQQSSSSHTPSTGALVPFREVWVRDQLLATTRRSMRRTMARRTNAAALRA